MRSSPKSVVKNLDFMFPKVDTEYTIRTEGGGVASLVAYALIFILVLAEVVAWAGQNSSTKEHISVDTSLGQRMRVNLNITFPGLACEDLHVDVMDVAGDSQLHIEDTMVKQRLSGRGRPMGAEEEAKSNQHRQNQEKREKILSEDTPQDYCGPCFGAQERDDQCCNTCDELIAAYEAKRWKTEMLLTTSEQCIREGRDKGQPKRMKRGEGCNLSGSMTVNRVAGNFHIAMGEGIERDGRHIHTFVPDDTPNFNASHIIHELSFGSPTSTTKIEDRASLNGVAKIVTKEHGTTGLFQYFIKIVPTTFISKNKKGGEGIVETNRYYYTERFRPLMKEFIDDDHYEDDDKRIDLGDSEEDDQKDQSNRRAAVDAGHKGGHSNKDHHDVRNAILPGVFFIYEIYPFAVEVTQNSVPLTHLLIRILATVGGVFTFVRWADAFFFTHIGRRRSSIAMS